MILCLNDPMILFYVHALAKLQAAAPDRFLFWRQL